MRNTIMAAGTLFACLLLAIAEPARGADEPARAQAAARLVGMLNLGASLRPMREGVVDQQARLAVQAGAPLQDVDVAELRDLIDGVMAPEVAAIEEFSAKLYAEMFTLAELEDMIAFYQSPTGRRVVAMTPEVGERLGAFQGELMPRLAYRITVAIQEMQQNRRQGGTAQ